MNGVTHQQSPNTPHPTLHPIIFSFAQPLYLYWFRFIRAYIKPEPNQDMFEGHRQNVLS